MSSLNRILKKISQGQTKKKTVLKRAVMKGFMPNSRDIKNLKIMLKRMYVDYKPNLSDSQIVRLYLNEKYKEEVHLQELSKKKKEVREKLSKHSNSHFIKLVK